MSRAFQTSSALTLFLAATIPAAAQDHVHRCVDDACTATSLFDDAPQGGSSTGSDALAVPRYGTWGFDLTGMDRSVEPLRGIVARVDHHPHLDSRRPQQLRRVRRAA